MALKVILPKWGLTMKTGKVAKWYKSEGDTIKKGESFFEVETEKITNVVEAEADGVVFQIVVPAGTTVPVGTILAIIAQPGEQPRPIEGIQAGEAAENAVAAGEKKEPAATKPAQPKKPAPSTPAARRLAKELGVDIGLVSGSGPKGRISEADVKKFHDTTPKAAKITPLAAEMIRREGLDATTVTGTGEGGKITRADVARAMAGAAATTPAETAPKTGADGVTVVPFSGLRKGIADNMYQSLHNTAQLTMFSEVDVTESLKFLDQTRKVHAKDPAVRISMNDIVMLAVSRALLRHPELNSNLVGEEILLFDTVHLGMAVAMDQGLMVPVIKNIHAKNLLEIAREARVLAKKAREGRLAVDDVTGGTFTITNVGLYAVDGFTPILKPPETGILGVGRVRKKPAEYQGLIALRDMMYISLTFDHQVVDGSPAGAFLDTVAGYLEQPDLILS